MQTIQVIQRGLGDYLHTDEEVHLTDETTGQTYELLVKGTQEDPGQRATVRIYVPDHLIHDTFSVSGYLVLELAPALNDEEANQRRQRIRSISRSESRG